MAGAVGVILAAGLGKRMRSGLLKVLHPVAGIPMVEHVLNALEEAGVARCIVVVGHQQEAVRRALGNRVEYAVQEAQLGTGHAALQARGLVSDDEDVVLLYGDTPLLTARIIRELLDVHRRSQAAATVLTVELADPRGYGRIVRDAAGRFLRIVEEADASPAEAAIREVNSGIYCFRAGPFFAALSQVRPNNAQGEYYLVDAIPILSAMGHRVETVCTDDPDAVRGVNTRSDLAAAEAVWRQRVVRRLWEEGVTVVDPGSTWIDPRVRVGRDTVILPGTSLSGATVIGRGCLIGPGARVVSSHLGDAVRVSDSVVVSSRIGDGCVVGPHAHVGPGAQAPGAAASDLHPGEIGG